MAEPIPTNDRFFIATMWLAIATNFIGVSACLMESPLWRTAYVFASIVTAASLLLTLARLLFSRRSPPRSGWSTHVTVALAIFWMIVLMVPTLTKVSDGNMMRIQSLNNVKQIGLAMQNYHDVYNHLPTDVRNDAQEPILSWRVQLLPFVDNNPLYKSFDLKEPWDGPANRHLLEKNPVAYMAWYFDEPEKTPWQGFVGSGTAFEPDRRKLSLRDDFPDGSANTILIVEANQLVPWSKPADIPYGPNIPLPSLGRDYYKEAAWPFTGYTRDSGFHAVMADGSVRFLSSGISENTLRAMIVRNDVKP